MIGRWLKKDLHAMPTTLLFCLLLPCLFCWFLGNLYVENIPFGVVDLDNSALSRQIVRGLEDHPGLAVSKVTDQQTLENDIYRKVYNGGMVIPEGFSEALHNKTPKNILTIVDSTNTLIGNNAMAYASAVTGTYGAGAMLTFLEASGMPATAAMHTYNTFQFVDRTLYDPYMSYLSYLMYFVMPYLVQMIVVCMFALPLFTELHEEIVLHGWKEVLTGKRIAEVLVRFCNIFIVTTAASWIGFCLADHFFGFPIRGVMWIYCLLLGAFEVALMAACMMLGVILKPKHCLYFFECYLALGMVILLTSGAIWLPYLMPEGLFDWVTAIWPFGRVALAFKLLNLKGSGWDIIAPYVGSCLRYALFWAVAAIAVTMLQRQWKAFCLQRKKEKTVLSKAE